MEKRSLRSEIETQHNIIHLNNAGVSPITKSCAVAYNRHLDQLKKGFLEIEQLLEDYENHRKIIADFIGIEPSQTAIMQTCAVALSQIALGFPFKEGDEIIRWDQEYPSNAYTWHAAARRTGAKVNVVSSEPHCRLNLEKVIEQITPKTKLVTTSWVQFQTGSVTDLKTLSEECHKVGAWLVVDVIQGLGVIPFDFEKAGVDAVCFATHKWLMGPLGLGVLALKKEHVETLEPIHYGACTYGLPDDPIDVDKKPHSEARRYEPGSQNFAGAAGAAASIKVLQEIGVENIYEQAIALSDQLREGIESCGLEVYSQTHTNPRSPIVTFAYPKDREKLISAFNENRVTHSPKPSGIRLSPHAFNTSEEIAQTIEIIKKST